jgi:hypothetical protein
MGHYVDDNAVELSWFPRPIQTVNQHDVANLVTVRFPFQLSLKTS